MFLTTFPELTYNLFCLEGKCCWKTDKYSGKRLAFTQSRRASFESKKTVWRTKYLKTGSFKNKTRGIVTLAYADGGISGRVQLLFCFGGGAARRFFKSCSAAKKVNPARHISHPANHPASYEGIVTLTDTLQHKREVCLLCMITVFNTGSFSLIFSLTSSEILLQ